MSTNVPQPAAAVPPPAPPTVEEVRVVSHSNIFYWWPVWAVGFIMAGVTLLWDRHLMVTVPPGTEAVHAKELQVTTVKGSKEIKDKDPIEHRDVIVLPKGGKLTRETKDSQEPQQPRIHMARNKNLGVIFCTTLLLVIVITNVPLRGMWSVVVIITIILLAVILALAGWWEFIVTKLGLLDIRINAGGYLFLSVVMFIIWTVAVFAFDRQTYIVFTPGQFKVCQSVGDGEKVYDTVGMSMERQRGDIFRHMILGLGSGDLLVKTTGAQSHHFDLPNVLFIGRKVQQIEELLRKRKVETK